MTADQREEFEERAGILEFCAGHTRAEAERIAAEMLGLEVEEFLMGTTDNATTSDR
jgi:hypothetical protein